MCVRNGERQGCGSEEKTEEGKHGESMCLFYAVTRRKPFLLSPRGLTYIRTWNHASAQGLRD